MYANSFDLPGLSPLAVSVSHAVIDAESPLNHNETHIHKECEIYLNLTGDVSFEVENKLYAISKGSVVITRPYEYHHCIYHSNSLHDHYWITFSVSPEDPFADLFFKRKRGEGNLLLLEADALSEACGILEELGKKETDVFQKRILFLRLLYLLKNAGVQDNGVSMPDLPRDVILAMDFIGNHMEEDISVKQMADAAYVSVNTLERHFKTYFHTTPVRLLKRKRVIYSMQLLRQGYSVADVAAKCGFSDYSNYIQYFRKQFGMTPMQFKKAHKG